MSTDQRARWRHRWVPLNWRAALLKAHHNRAQARRLLEAQRGRMGVDTWSPGFHPAAGERPAPATTDRGSRRVSTAPAPALPAALGNVSDEALSSALAGADEAEVTRVLAELDRRDKRAAAKARASARRTDSDTKRAAAFDAALSAGTDPETAYADVYGVTVERQRRRTAITALRDQGYAGAGLAQLCQSVFKEHAELAYLAAESETHGHMLNKAGQRAHVNPRELFTGPESRARKYASDDLLAFWQEKGRLTVDDFTASALGGAGRSLTTGYFL